MEDQWLVVPKEEEEEEGTECGRKDSLIVQEFLKSVPGLPTPPPPLEENATDSQASLGRDKEDPQQASSGETRRESVLQRDPNIYGKTRMGREKLHSSVKVKMEETQEEVNLESQVPLSLSSQKPKEKARPLTL
ncbi:hypothetical protein E2320_014486 [Naja naja]|nr:hypothetical protein E2320_014486 [Naja naja]